MRMNKKTILMLISILTILPSVHKASAQENADQPQSAPAASGHFPLRIWGGGGPALIIAAERYFGARIAGGFDITLDTANRFFIGFQLVKPISGERLDGRFAGGIHRSYLLPSLGMFFIPETLYGRIALGLGYLSSENPDMTAKLKPAYGFGLGYRVKLSPHVDIGPEISFEYSGQAQKSVAFLIDDLSCAFGECDAFGTIPRAAIWSMNLILGYSF